jgi:hypothetical protein
MRSRAFRAAAVALALVASATAARAGGGLTSLPAGTVLPVSLNNIASVPSGYTFVTQKDNNGVTLSNGAMVNLDQLVYKNASGQLGFLYQLTAVSASAAHSVMGFDTSNFSTVTSGNGTGGAPLSAGFFGGPSGVVVGGSRPDSNGETVSFAFTPLTSSGTTLDIFMATTATSFSSTATGSTAITPNGSGGSTSVSTFEATPEPGALALAFLGVPLVATACYRRWGSRPQRA